jgi:hypothetical protein
MLANVFDNIKNVLERINSPNFLTLFNNTALVTLFKYGKPHTIVSMVTMVEQWVQLWNTLFHKYGCNFHTKILWFPWLPVWTLYSHVDWCKFFIHLRSLNVRHLVIFEATGLKVSASRLPSVALPPYWISWNFLLAQKFSGWQTYSTVIVSHSFPLLRKAG